MATGTDRCTPPIEKMNTFPCKAKASTTICTMGAVERDFYVLNVNKQLTKCLEFELVDKIGYQRCEIVPIKLEAFTCPY